MTENERIAAIPRLMDWRRQDETVALMVRTILVGEGQPDIGSLARHNPEMFDLLYEEAEAMVENPV